MIDDIAAWRPWLKRNAVIAGLLSGARRSDPDAYLVRIHAASEAVLRRVLLIGLRRNSVRYSDATLWLHDNDSTPTRSSYGAMFDRLFGVTVNFSNLLSGSQHLPVLWDLWLDFSKTVRNHVSHGIRKYDDQWLECAVKIDQAFIIELCAALSPYVGGSVASDLRKLTPRLSMGKPGISIPTLLGRKGGKPRPIASLQSAQSRFGLLGIA